MNSKSSDTIDQFITLRARGIPYAKIASQLNVSRPTLIDWSRKHADRLRNECAIEKEAAAEQAKAAQQVCDKKIADLRERILEELARRDLQSVPTDRLALLAWRLQRASQPETDKLTFTEAFTDAHIMAGDIPDPKLTWQA